MALETSIPSRRQFLVRLDLEHFYIRTDGREIACTDVPSVAAHLSYTEADRLCQKLLRRGFPGAYVTDEIGRPVTLATLGILLPPSPSLPETPAEVDAIPARELRRRFIGEPEFRDRVRAIEARRTAGQR